MSERDSMRVEVLLPRQTAERIERKYGEGAVEGFVEYASTCIANQAIRDPDAPIDRDEIVEGWDEYAAGREWGDDDE